MDGVSVDIESCLIAQKSSPSAYQFRAAGVLWVLANSRSKMPRRDVVGTNLRPGYVVCTLLLVPCFDRRIERP